MRYTGTTITGGGTIAYADIDNTDNIKAGDKIIDISGAIYAIASVDTANQTVTVGTTAIIDLAVLPDLFNSANTWNALNTYSNGQIRIKSQNQEIGVIPSSGVIQYLEFADKNDAQHGIVGLWDYDNGASEIQMYITDKFKNGAKDPTGTSDSTILSFGFKTDGSKFLTFSGQVDNSVIPKSNNTYNLGASTYKWKSVWFNNLQDIATDTVEWHNSHYRGINLISDGHFANMAALLTAIRNQDWSDIYIGDYVELTFTYEGASRTVKFYVGEIDKFYKVGNTSLETHHLVMVTGDLGINQVMNDTNTTAGGYVGSKAHTVTLPALYAILNPLFNNAILTHKEHLSNTVISAQSVSLSLDDGNGAVSYTCSNFPVYSSGDPNTQGCVTAGNWYDCNLVLMSEIEMFGSNRFASSGIDDIMCPEGQIAAFKYNRNLQTLNRTINTWLRNVNSASRFCHCDHYGFSHRDVATYADVRLRPRFLIG